MQDLRLIGVHEDGQHVLLTDGEGARFRLPLDEQLRAAARRDRPRLGQLQIEIDGGLRPRDVQAMIRAGASAEEAAERAGWTVEKVQRYEGPILAEREHIAGQARTVRLRSRSGSPGSDQHTLGARVSQRLAGRGVDPATAEWDSARTEDGDWTVSVTFAAGGRVRQGRWSFDGATRTVSAVDDEARWLSEEDSADSPVPSPHLVSSPARTTTVYDVEAEGGVAAAPSRRTPDRRPGQDEPVDLMTAMRERSAARGRRSGARRKGKATATPVDEAPREDALPLEDMAYDPDLMPPPPAARGIHPLDLPEADPGAVIEEPTPGERVVEDPAGEEPTADEPGADEPVADAPVAEEPVAEKPAAEKRTDEKPRRKAGRPSVPSWDDVMFGAPRPGS
jgi:hypothetical protein